MAVKIRLSRVGTKHAPVYRVVAIDSRSKRDGRALEILGTYNPIRDVFDRFDTEKIQAWVAKGAILTDSVKKLSKKFKKLPKIGAQATASAEVIREETL